MPPLGLLAIYCAVIVLASLGGGWVPIFARLTHQRVQLVISGIAGFMLGVGLLSMLPHAAEELGGVEAAVPWMLGGFLAMFFIARFASYHHHDVPSGTPPEAGAEGAPAAAAVKATPGVAAKPDYEHEHEHEHEHGHGHEHGRPPEGRPWHTAHGAAPGECQEDHPHTAHRLTWSGAAVGLSLHSLLDGVALAAAVAAGSAGHAPATLAGLAVFLVIATHRPFDAMTLVTLMRHDGWSNRACHLVNGLFALIIPVGALLFVFGLAQAMGEQHQVIGAALGVTAGTFLCISSSDLLPELQFHEHDRWGLSLALIAGLAIAFGVSRLDVHEHEHGPREADQPAPAVEPEHAGHDHAGHGHRH